MKLFRNISSILLSMCILLGVLALPQNIIVSNAASDSMTLYYVDTFCNENGLCNYNIYIKTNHNTRNNAVSFYYCAQNSNQWYDKTADYVTTLSDGSQIWNVNFSAPIGISYAIKYVGDGQTFWSNNNGNNYIDSDQLGDPILKIKKHRYCNYPDSSTIIHVSATLKNIAYNKTVKVRYTEDNWNTYTDVPLSYSSSNTSNNIEIWSASFHLDTTKLDSFQYYAYYTINGVTYWESNFGACYDINYGYFISE